MPLWRFGIFFFSLGISWFWHFSFSHSHNCKNPPLHHTKIICWCVRTRDHHLPPHKTKHNNKNGCQLNFFSSQSCTKSTRLEEKTKRQESQTKHKELRRKFRKKFFVEVFLLLVICKSEFVNLWKTSKEINLFKKKNKKGKKENRNHVGIGSCSRTILRLW